MDSIKPKKTSDKKFKRVFHYRRHMKDKRLKSGKHKTIPPFEIELLNLTVPLKDGFIGEVVTVEKIKRVWRYTCHVCNCKKLPWVSFAKHCRRDKHLETLKKPVFSNTKFPIRYRPGDNMAPKAKHTVPRPLPDTYERRGISRTNYSWISDTYNQASQNKERSSNYLRPDNNVQTWQYYKATLHSAEAIVLGEMASYYKQNPGSQNYISAHTLYWEKRAENLMGKDDNPEKCNNKNEFLEYWSAKLKQKIQILCNEKAQLNQILYNQSSKISDGQNNLSVSTFNEKTPNSDYMSDFTERNSECDVSIVNILRLLSVFEDELGTLGPKVITLLTEALQLKKSSSPDSLLLSHSNCLFLEDVKQKLINILETGVMQQSKKQVMDKLIRDITNLLFTFDKRSDARSDIFNEKQSYDNPKPLQEKIYKVSEVLQVIRNLEFLSDLSNIKKFEMSQMIASSLLLRHQTDITESGLMREIDTYIENKSEDQVSTHKQNSRHRSSSNEVKSSYLSLGHSSEVYDSSCYMPSHQQYNESYYPSRTISYRN